ncbi:MAG: outer membrane protein assembly factor BamE [Bdellovibrio sp.]
MLRYRAIPVILLSLLLAACQTSMLKQFEKVKAGMEKDDVLDIMGSPQRTQRFHGKDRWTYIFYDDRIRFEKEIQFFEGNAVYIGEISQPEPEQSAVAIDTSNEDRNKEIDAQLARDMEEHRRAYDQYELKSKGADKVRYLPTFEPIR